MADDSNVHRVTPVTEGERMTLTMWFTLEPAFCEDTVILRQLNSGDPRSLTIYQTACTVIHPRFCMFGIPPFGQYLSV